jgi:SAM-dependent methyltransferase
MTMKSALDHQVDYWDRIGPTKPFSHPIDFERFAELVPRDRRVLDVGCGYGRGFQLLSERGYGDLAGLDIAPAMIAAARTRVPGARLQVITDPTALPVEDGSVDAVLLFSVLTCVPTDEGQRALIKECRRVLASDGLLYVSDLWLQQDARNLERYARFHDKYGVYGVFELPEGVVVRHHDRRWIESLLGAFESVALRDTSIVTMNGHRAAAFQWFGRRRSEIVKT